MRSFTDIFIKHPVLAVVVNLVIVLVGVRALLNLPVQQFPSVESSSVIITTVYYGASAETVRGDPRHESLAEGRRSTGRQRLCRRPCRRSRRGRAAAQPATAGEVSCEASRGASRAPAAVGGGSSNCSSTSLA